MARREQSDCLGNRLSQGLLEITIRPIRRQSEPLGGGKGEGFEPRRRGAAPEDDSGRAASGWPVAPKRWAR